MNIEKPFFLEKKTKPRYRHQLTPQQNREEPVEKNN